MAKSYKNNTIKHRNKLSRIIHKKINIPFKVKIAHQPQMLEIYSAYNFDLVFCGHAHGGQIRLFGQGLYAPEQGFFPEYTGGVYKLDGTTEIVSRGIGNSVIPVRLFDRPELVYCTLKKG